MELLYIYLHNYRSVFKEQQFNFSGDLRFAYNNISKELTIERNELYITNFFQVGNDRNVEDGRIVNITGIIGKNGSGKTTILEFLKENLVEGAGGISEKAIIVTRSSTGEGKIFVHSELGIEKGNFKDYNFDPPILYNETADKLVQDFTTVLSNTTVVFYSNIFDARQEREWAGMRNISTNYLVKQTKRFAVEMKSIPSDFSETELFRREEIRKQLHFIYRSRQEKIEVPIKLPALVRVSARSSRFDQLIEDERKQTKTEKTVYALRDSIINRMNEKKSSVFRLSIDEIKLQFFKALIDAFLLELLTMPRSIDKEKLQSLTLNDEADNWHATLSKLIDTISGAMKYYGEKNWIISVKELLNFFEEYINKDTVIENTFIIPLTDKENDFEPPLKKLLDLHVKAARFMPFLDFDWGDLSSGEKALLSSYARFFALKDDQQLVSNMNLNKNLLILIDEGELYLHPEWQKSFIYNLIRYLPSIYPNRNIQLVITSNSPIIISDLPKGNLIFIDKSENGCRVIDGLKETKQTFAANIHTLFADAFFIKTGLIGEFANHLLLSLINTVNESPSHELFERRRELESLINLIGEPVLRTKITGILKSKINDYVENAHVNTQLIETIRKMQNEIEALKRGN